MHPASKRVPAPDGAISWTGVVVHHSVALTISTAMSYINASTISKNRIADTVLGTEWIRTQRRRGMNPTK